MELNHYLRSKINLIALLSIFIGLTSCGTYQHSSYDDDGVYGTSEREVEQRTEVVVVQAPEKQTYYENYFKEKAASLDNIDNDGAIFTDIDSYESYTTENDTLDVETNYAGWGYNSNDVTINIYNRPNFYRPWFFNSWYYPYYWHNNLAFGYFDYWNSPFYIGWNRPTWNYLYYYPHYYGNTIYYNRRGIAYNAGRRGGIYPNTINSGLVGRRSLTNNSVVTGRRASTVNRNYSPNTRTRTNVRPRRSTRVDNNSTPRTITRPRTTTRRTNNTSTRQRTTRTTTRRRNYTTQPNINTNSYRSSRSSNSVRSSGNSIRTRSSGSRSSGRRSSGRGNN